MKAITILPSRILAPIILVSAIAAPAFGAGDLFKSAIERANREASARQWAGARAQLREQILAFNQQIAGARARFWETYPDKPGAALAAQQFANLLREKDAYSLAVVLSGGMLDLGGVGVQMDEGIRQSAGPEFEALVAAARSRVGGSDMMGWMRSILGAIDANPKEYHEYVLERDWWEFDHVHRIPTGFEKPETYGLYLYHRFAKLPEERAVASYDKMQEVLGKQLVYDAAKKVMEAPKTDHGILVVTAPRPVKIGPGGAEVDDDAVPMPEGVIGVYSNPLVAMEVLATQGDDRRYLIFLFKGQYYRDNLRLFDVSNKWSFAATVYDRLKIAFGEQELLQAAHAVRVAKKRMTSGDVMDPKAIGSTRIDPFTAFEDILARKDPRGYVRSALIFNQKLDSPAAVDASYKTLVSTSN
jgi:hypothetical protein